MRSCLICLTAIITLATSAPARANPCGPVPQVVILLDRSGSMKASVGGQSKWAIAKSAVQQLTSNFTGQIDFGLMLFSRWPHVKNCSSGKINISVGPGTSGSIMGTLGSAYPDGDTPIALTLDSARSYLAGVKVSGRPQHVLLITDGKETCQPASVNSPPTAAGKLSTNGIKTYVVGFGSGVDPTSLSDTAKAGNTSNYYQANNTTQLEAALKKIAADISCCGDGKLDPGELCDIGISFGSPGACPTSCNDNNKCTVDSLSGSACDTLCSYNAIATPINGDGCCPPGANSSTDSDCPAACGNGVLDAGEKCDTKLPAGSTGACPTNCDDKNSCTKDTMIGNGCQAHCTHTNTCPVNKCGNNKLDPGEKCDTAIGKGKPGYCPKVQADCDDKNPKTKDFVVSSGCMAYCGHHSGPPCGNGVVDPGEWCDKAIPAGTKGACPKNCDDGDKCTKDTKMGKECLAKCAHQPITKAAHGDGCCPPGASNATDNDCPKNSKCGNGKLDPGETCDPGIKSGAGACKKSCDDKNPCTKDVLGGSKCNVKCFYNPTSANKSKKDGCCPTGLSSDLDADCPPPCGPDKKTNCVDPCKGVKCPDGYFCKYGKCEPWPKGSKLDGGPGGGPGGEKGVEGGCDCEIGAAETSRLAGGLWALMALVLLLARRRRGA